MRVAGEQGTLLKRHKIAKRSVGAEAEYFAWSDFVIGSEVTIYGRYVLLCATSVDEGAVVGVSLNPACRR